MEVQRQQRRDLESDREAERRAAFVYYVIVLSFITAVAFIVLFLFDPGSLEVYSPTVHVASLSLSLPSAASPSPSVVRGNWSVALSVKSHMRWHQLGWDHAQVMLFYGHEFVAGTFPERFSVAPKGEGTLVTGAAAFSRDVGEWVARAMGRDGKDGGVMELELRLLYHHDGSREWFGWDSFRCRGLKVGFSSQNHSQVGLLLSASPHKCT